MKSDAGEGGTNERKGSKRVYCTPLPQELEGDYFRYGGLTTLTAVIISSRCHWPLSPWSSLGLELTTPFLNVGQMNKLAAWGPMIQCFENLLVFSI